METKLQELVGRIKLYRDKITTEEATKNSLIVPLFEILGYDIRNPLEFIPEYVADVGIKKGEKVDYAIIINDKPQILIEAKWVGDKLVKHDTQLIRYFSATKAKIAILTNGIQYKFFTDLDESNKMDEKPFLELDLLNLSEANIIELKKFIKNDFDINKILLSAEELKYANEVKKFLLAEVFKEQGSSFVEFVMGQTYEKRKSQSWKNKMTAIIKNTFSDVVEEVISKRIGDTRVGKVIPVEESISVISEKSETKEENQNHVPKIVTTDEELEGYAIICDILDNMIRTDKITYKDTVNYFAVLLENNSQKWICRLYFNSHQKSISIPVINSEGKSENSINIDDVNDIYTYRNEIKKIALKLNSL